MARENDQKGQPALCWFFGTNTAMQQTRYPLMDKVQTQSA